MVIKAGDAECGEMTAPRNGKGKALYTAYSAMRGTSSKFKTFNMMTLEPNSAIGFHKHEIDAECYLLLEGSAKYNDNGTEVIVNKGDLMYCAKGESHSIEALNGEKAVFLAFIVD